MHFLFIARDAGTASNSAWARNFFYVMLCYASSFNLLSDHHYRVFQAPSGDINISSSLRCFLVAFILWVLVHCYRCVSAVIIVTSYCNTLTIIYAYTVFTTSPFLNNSVKKNQPILTILVNHIPGEIWHGKFANLPTSPKNCWEKQT